VAGRQLTVQSVVRRQLVEPNSTAIADFVDRAEAIDQSSA